MNCTSRDSALFIGYTLYDVTLYIIVFNNIMDSMYGVYGIERVVKECLSVQGGEIAFMKSTFDVGKIEF